MKKWEFNSNRKQFDQYKHGWYSHGPWVKFETGDMMLHHYAMKDKDNRKHYQDLNLGIYDMSTGERPDLIDPKSGDPLKASEIDRDGLQTFVVDHETGFAYGAQLGTIKNVPAHASRACLYWANPSADPITRGGIKVSTAFKGAEKKALLAKQKAVRAVVSAQVKMGAVGGTEPPHTPFPQLWSPMWMKWEVQDILDVLPDHRLNHIAVAGFLPVWDERTYPRLVIKERKLL